MSKYRLTIDFDDATELAKAAALLAGAKVTTAPAPAAGNDKAPAPSPAPAASKVTKPAPPAQAPASPAAAPAQSTSSDTSAAGGFEYATLQKAVFALANKSRDEVQALTKKFGVTSFKELAEDRWEEAYNAVKARLDALEVA